MKANGFRPMNDMVLIAPVIVDKIGSIWVPEKYIGKAVRGTVVAVGPGKLTSKGVRLPTGLKVGDVVFWRFNFEQSIEIDGEKFAMLPSETEILGVEEK